MASNADWQKILEMLLYRSQAEGWREMAYILSIAFTLALEGQPATERNARSSAMKRA